MCVQSECVHLHMSVCESEANQHVAGLCIRSGIYVKVLIFSSHFLVMFRITVSMQNLFNIQKEKNNGGK